MRMADIFGLKEQRQTEKQSNYEDNVLGNGFFSKTVIYHNA